MDYQSSATRISSLFLIAYNVGHSGGGGGRALILLAHKSPQGLRLALIMPSFLFLYCRLSQPFLSLELLYRESF